MSRLYTKIQIGKLGEVTKSSTRKPMEKVTHFGGFSCKSF